MTVQDCFDERSQWPLEPTSAAYKLRMPGRKTLVNRQSFSRDRKALRKGGSGQIRSSLASAAVSAGQYCGFKMFAEIKYDTLTNNKRKAVNCDFE